ARAANVSASRKSSWEKRGSGPSLSWISSTPIAWSGDQRYPHAGAGSELPRHLLVHLGIVDHRVDALAPAALEHGTAFRLGTGDGRPQQFLGTGHGGEPQLVTADRQRERDDPRLEELAQAPDDEVEQLLEIRLCGQRVADL